MEHGRTSGIGRFYRTRGGRWLLAALLTLAALAVLLPFCDITYLNNDDANIARALSGAQTGTPYPTHPFIHFVLGVCVSACYRVLPAVPWWTVFQLAFLFFGMTAAGACLLTLCGRRGVRMCIPCAVWVFAVWALYGYAVCQITFTLTSAVLGAAGVALFLTMEPGERGWTLDAALGVLCAVLCFFVRNSGGRAMLPFWGLALVYRAAEAWLRKERRVAARQLGTLAVLAAAAVLTLAGYRYGFVRWNAEAYPAFDDVRSRYLDYPVDSYAENPALYASAGWDGTLASLADNWFFMDARVNAESLGKITSGSAAQNRPAIEKLRGAIEAGVTLARGNGQMLYILTAFLAVLLAAAYRFRRRADWPAFAATVCFGGGAFLMCLYLGYSGRFLLRTFEMLAYPAFCGMLLCAVRVGAPGEPRIVSRAAKLCWRAAAALSAMLLLWGTGNAVRFLTARDASAEVAQIRTLKAYAAAHPENLYIRDTSASDDIDAFPAAGILTVNLLDWGGTGMYTGAQQEQLRQNGLESLDMSAFAKENTYFVTTEGAGTTAIFETYLRENALGTLIPVDTLPNGVRIFRIG